MRRVSSQRTRSASASSRSTRRVTSSRFPIGVAQTASGISRVSASKATAPRRSSRQRSRARPGRRGTPCIGFSASRSITSRAGSSSSSPAAANPPPITISSGRTRSRGCRARSRACGRSRSDLDRLRVALVRQPHEAVRVGGRAEASRASLVRGLAGDDTTRGGRARRSARRPRRGRSRCGRARRRADRAPVRPAPENQPAADTRPRANTDGSSR